MKPIIPQKIDLFFESDILERSPRTTTPKSPYRPPRIGIDLDDGVKVNYEKVQTGVDGKKIEILARI